MNDMGVCKQDITKQNAFLASQDIFDKLKTSCKSVQDGDIIFCQGVRVRLHKLLPENTLIATGELAIIAKEMEDDNDLHLCSNATRI